MSRVALEELFLSHHVNNELVIAPAGGRGGNYFPAEELDALDEERTIASALVARCGVEGITERPYLGQRTARYVFYIDEEDVAFHAEDRSFILGL
jgi:hypothetical protein